MFYTTFGRIVSGLTLVYGIVEIGMGFIFADIGGITEVETGELHSLMGAASKHIENGFYIIIVAIALGILTDISRSVSKANHTE